MKTLLSNNWNSFFISIKRLRLKNHNFSIIANNCCGGIIYHDLGEKFLSPTINLAMEPDDFLLFVENLDESLSKEVEPVKEDKSGTPPYPVGKIELSSGTVTINFMHYQTFADAAAKWNERKERIRRDNLFVFFELGVFTSDEYVERFRKLPYRKIAITNKLYPYKDTEFIDIYQDYHWGKLIEYVPGKLHTKRYLDSFDYVRWLNGER